MAGGSLADKPASDTRNLGDEMNLSLNSRTRLLVAALCTAAIAGCDSVTTADESASIPGPATTVVIGGTVSGLGATRPVELSITTTNNGVNDGTRTVSVRGTNVLRLGSVAIGANYTVAITRTPFGRTCTLTNGSGTVTAEVNNITVACVRDSTPLYTLTANIASGLSAAPPAGFAVTLTTEEGSETITPTTGQTSVTFTLPVFFPPSDSPPTFNYTVTATNTVGGTTNNCQVTNATGALPAVGVTPGNITNVTVASCLYTVSAAVQYSTPPGGTASAMGAGGVQLGLRNQFTGAIVAHAPLITAFSTTAVAFPGTFAANSQALYEIVVESHPANQFCIVQNGGRVQWVIPVIPPFQTVAQYLNQSVQVRCRDVPVLANQLKGVYQLDTPPISEVATTTAPILSVGSVIPTPRVQTRNFLAFFPNGTFIYGTHPNTAEAGVEHGYYNYNPGAGTLAFTVFTDTNGTGASTAAPPAAFRSGISGRQGYSGGAVTANNVTRTAGSVGTAGRLSMTFGTVSGTYQNPTWTMTEPVSTPGQIQGSWTTADSKRVFVYNKTTFYGFHAGVNGAPNLQDACFTILDATLAESFYTRRGGDTGCMAAITTTAGGGPEDGLTNVGTVDVPNATTTNTTAPLIPGFIGRLPGSLSNAVLSPSPVNYTVVPGTPDTITIQNTLNGNPIDAPVVFQRATTY